MKNSVNVRKLVQLHRIAVMQLVQAENLRIIYANSIAKNIFKRKEISEEVILKKLHPKDIDLFTNRLFEIFLNVETESIDSIRIRTSNEYTIYKMSMCSFRSEKDVILQIHLEESDNIEKIPILSIVDFELVDLNSRFSPKNTEVTGVITNMNNEASSFLQHGDRAITDRTLTIYNILDEEYHGGIKSDIVDLVVYKKPIKKVVLKVINKNGLKILTLGELSIYEYNNFLMGRYQYINIKESVRSILTEVSTEEAKSHAFDLVKMMKRTLINIEEN